MTVLPVAQAVEDGPRVVLKWDLDPWRAIYEMPADAQLLHVAVQNGRPRLWTLSRPDAPMAQRMVHVVPTGVVFDDGRRHVGSFELVEDGLQLVFHVFDGGTPTT